MSRRTLWTIVFLGITGVAVGMELWAGLDSIPDTVPWTDYLIQLPWWILMPLALALSVWLPIHLWIAKKRRTQAK
jgi:hypothetical protein